MEIDERSVLMYITVEEGTKKQHGTAIPTAKKSVMLEEILVCPNCTSLLRTWYQSTVTRITCPKCWAEIPVENPQINRFEVAIHHSEIKSNGYASLKEGQKVEFEIGEGKKGPCAINVVPA